MQHQQLLRSKRELSVGPSLVVRELHLASTVENLDNGAHLPAHETLRGHVGQERYNIEEAWCRVQGVLRYFTKQFVSRGTASPRRTIQALTTMPLPLGPTTSDSIT